MRNSPPLHIGRRTGEGPSGLSSMFVCLGTPSLSAAPPPDRYLKPAVPLPLHSSSVAVRSAEPSRLLQDVGKVVHLRPVKNIIRLSLCFTHFVPSIGFRRVERSSFGACPHHSCFVFQATRPRALVRAGRYFVCVFSSYGNTTTDSFGLLGIENRQTGPHMRPTSFCSKMFAVSRCRHSTLAQSTDH